VVIQIGSITNTSTAGNYYTDIATSSSTGPVDTGLTSTVTFTAGTLSAPIWTTTSSVASGTGVSYTYTFTTTAAGTLTSVTMTVPPGTAGTPAVGAVSGVPTGGTIALSLNTLTYSFTGTYVGSSVAVSIQVTGLTNTASVGSYTSQITTNLATGPLATGTTAPIAISGGTLVSPIWATSNAGVGASGATYTYTFRTVSTATLTSVSFTVPPGTAGTPAVGTVSGLPVGGTVALSGGTLTYSFTGTSIPATTNVSVAISGLTNTATAGSYTAQITTSASTGPIDSGITAPVSFSSGVLSSPTWAVSNTTSGQTGVTYTYTFTTGTGATLTSVSMTVPPLTAGTPVVGTITGVPTGGTISLASNTLTYTFPTGTYVNAGTAVSIQITGMKNTTTGGTYTSQITTSSATSTVDTGTTGSVSILGGNLVTPTWSVSNSAAGQTAVTYTYGFKTTTTSNLSSVTMTVPSGTAGTPVRGTITGVPATGTVALAANVITYTFTSTSIPSGTTVSLQFTGLTNTSTVGSYTSNLATKNGATVVDVGTTPTVVISGLLTLTAPTSLTWAVTLNGTPQWTTDATTADQQYTVDDQTGSGLGWHVTVSATTFTTGTYSLADTGSFQTNGSVSLLSSTAGPSAQCVSTCTLPTNTSTYPVAITTAASSPTAYTIFDTAAGTGLGNILIGGSSSANPIGWWINVPATARAGVYTSTVTFSVISAP
jgi:hypothetical protein